MADEVIIVEMRKPSKREGQLPIFGDIITTQVLDIATASAALNASTEMIQIISKGTGFWYKIGASGVSAAADTDGNVWLGADKEHSISIEGDKYIDTAADV